MILELEQYYPCLAPEEQGACRYALESIVPPFVFVFPVSAITDYYNSLSTNFDGRQDFWASMFRFGKTTIEPVPGVEVEVYTDPYGFTDQWRMYTVLNGHWPLQRCRIAEYTPFNP